MINRHERIVALTADKIFDLLEDMGTENDQIWPASFPFRRTKGPMKIGFTIEQHGIIKATLSEYEKNAKIVWSAEQSFMKGTHGFYLEPQLDGKTKLIHFLCARLTWWFLPIWYFRIETLHNKIIEGILDRVEIISCSIKN